MAVPAYKITDKRGKSSYRGSSNTLIKAARRQPDRESIFDQNRDFHRNISEMGRRVLVTYCRSLFWNSPVVKGAVLEQARLAAATFLPQYYGANREWGNQAEEWLLNWHKICDIAGPPNDRATWLRFLMVTQFTDGDMGTILTGTPIGSDEMAYPMLQCIPSHRIQSYIADYAQGGPYDGYRIMDGVIVNDYGRAMAYRVYSDAITGAANVEFDDIPTTDMMLTFDPVMPGQSRGIPWLCSSVFNFQDSAEFDRFEMLAQKAFSAQTLIESNESGAIDEAQAVIGSEATYDDSDKQLTPTEQQLQGGIYRYFKANSGSKLEAFSWDRPAAAAQQFQERKIRDAFKGSDWDVFFSLDPQAVGGAPMRVIVEKINGVLDERRAMLAKACARVDGYALSKAIKNGDLPFDPDWYKFEYQGPGDVTADAKYDSDVGLQETAQGFSTRKIQAAKRGEYWEDLDHQRELEADSDLERAGRLAKKHGVTIQEALVILRPPTPSGQLPQPAPEPAAKKAQP